MFDSIYVGMTGLLGYSRGLRVIANNTANMNTPGFKSSSLQFTDLFYSGRGSGSGAAGQGQVGFGLNTVGTTLSFAQGDFRQTGNGLDLAVDGQGFFITRDTQGKLGYTRAGQFKFDADGILVSNTGGAKVMGLDTQGKLEEITLNGYRTHPGKPTTVVKFSGNLSSTASEQTISGINVVDGVGGTHALSLKLTNTEASKPGSWKVEVLDGMGIVGTGSIEFNEGAPVEGADRVPFTYQPQSGHALGITLDFSANVTSWAAGDLSTLTMASQDGVVPGVLVGTSFDSKGVANFSYSNGQTGQGARLALAWFESPDAVGSDGGNSFEVLDSHAWHIGSPADGVFGSLRAGTVEMSNVNLSQEFSDLVVMQRGYQASSQVISTANDMIQELFSMKSR